MVMVSSLVPDQPIGRAVIGLNESFRNLTAAPGRTGVQQPELAMTNLWNHLLRDLQNAD
jgi:hypothetical protein